MKVLLCAIAKNENKYIREWVEYHKHLGFDNIVLYDNNEVNGEHFEEVINDYIFAGYVILKNVRGFKTTAMGPTAIQNKSYTNCIQTYKSNYNFIAFIDIDEFITLTEDNTIQQYLSRSIFNKYTDICLCWKCYGDSDLTGDENIGYSVLNRFTKPIKEQNNDYKYNDTVFKKIVRANRFNNKTIAHDPHQLDNRTIKNDNPNCCNSVGEPIQYVIHDGPALNNASHDLAYIRHYCTKTYKEYEIKCKSGDAAQPDGHKLEEFWKYNIRKNETPR